MFSNRLAVATLGIACVAAAGLGSYIATRQNVAGVAAPPIVAASQPSAEPVAAPQPRSGPLPATQHQEPIAAVPKEPSSPQTAAPAEARPANAPRQTAQAGNPQHSKAATASMQAEHPTTVATASAATAQASPLPATQEPAPLAAPPDEHPVELPKPTEPPARSYEELVVAADSVIGLQTQTALSSERARVEDRVEARVTRDVRVNGEVAIPAGTRVLGTVMVVDRGGKFRERARLGVRFHTLLFADGTRMPMTTDTIYRYGDAPSDRSAAKIGGGAVAGAILGAIIGGGKGAAIGATTGAGAGTAATMASDRSAATLPAGVEITARILSPLSVSVEK